MMHIALARRYRRGMQALRRWAGGDPGILADAGMGIVGAGLTAVAVGGPSGLVGTAIAGPEWLRAQPTPGLFAGCARQLAPRGGRTGRHRPGPSRDQRQA